MEFTECHIDFHPPTKLQLILKWAATWQVLPCRVFHLPEHWHKYFVLLEVYGGQAYVLSARGREQIRQPHRIVTLDWASRRHTLFLALSQLAQSGSSLQITALKRVSANILLNGKQFQVAPITAQAKLDNPIYYALAGEPKAERAQIVVAHDPTYPVSAADLTDRQWIQIAPIVLDGVRRGRHSKYSTRDIINTLRAIEMGQQWHAVRSFNPALANAAHNIYRKYKQTGRWALIKQKIMEDGHSATPPLPFRAHNRSPQA